MIASTSLKHPSTLLNIKKAILAAVRQASSKSYPHIQPVFNSKGKIWLAVLATEGGKYQIQDHAYDNVTDIVNKALREYHDKK